MTAKETLTGRRKNMDSDSKILPGDAFPEDLTTVDDDQLQILYSQVHRVLDAEYLNFSAEPETEGR